MFTHAAFHFGQIAKRKSRLEILIVARATVRTIRSDGTHLKFGSIHWPIDCIAERLAIEFQ